MTAPTRQELFELAVNAYGNTLHEWRMVPSTENCNRYVIARTALLAFGLPDHNDLAQTIYSLIRNRHGAWSPALAIEANDNSQAIAKLVLAYRRPSKP